LAKQPAQQKRNANATAPPAESFQPKNGKNKTESESAAMANPLGRSPLYFSLSLSLGSAAHPLSLCCACAKAELQSSGAGTSGVDRRGLGG